MLLCVCPRPAQTLTQGRVYCNLLQAGQFLPKHLLGRCLQKLVWAAGWPYPAVASTTVPGSGQPSQLQTGWLQRCGRKNTVDYSGSWSPAPAPSSLLDTSAPQFSGPEIRHSSAFLEKSWCTLPGKVLSGAGGTVSSQETLAQAKAERTWRIAKPAALTQASIQWSTGQRAVGG